MHKRFLVFMLSNAFSNCWGDQEGLFDLVTLNFIFKWYNWSNFRLLTTSH
jgi:hypothetical protein